MRIAFCLFKYFPYGGLQRDFLDVALLRQAAGDEVYVYTRSWQGEKPQGMVIREIESKALSNHVKYERYFQQVKKYIQQDEIECIVGFNKLPGLDIYFASDPSYKARNHSWIQRMSPRYRHFMEYERTVFEPQSRTHILILAEAQQHEYQQAWHTPDERFTFMPPGIHRSACAPDNAAELRSQYRRELGFSDDDLVLFTIGSGFRTKGLDRTLTAVKALPDAIRKRVRLLAIGQDKAAPFLRMARGLGLESQFSILPGRGDISAVMQAGDILMHPAYREVAGKVILEAVVAGLPVVVTDVCGYAHHVKQANAGIVLDSPFQQEVLNKALLDMLETNLRSQWRDNGIRYGQTQDLYSMAEAASTAIESRCLQ